MSMTRGGAGSRQQEDKDMKVIVIGATGTIGGAVVHAIGNRCEVIPVNDL